MPIMGSNRLKKAIFGLKNQSSFHIVACLVDHMGYVGHRIGGGVKCGVKYTVFNLVWVGKRSLLCALV